MDSTAEPGQSASGGRSVAAHTISGTVATGDNTRIVTLERGTIPGPGQVALVGRVDNLPRPPAPVFMGRDAALGLLGRELAGDASVVITQAVYGLGGVGKSELALHHADSHRADYTLIWWITAEDQAQIQAGLAALAARLCPEIAMIGTTVDAAGWAVAWLQIHDRWLLILDNVNESEDVVPLLGQLTNGHILVTTRRDTGWDQVADPIRLDVLDPRPATDLLTIRTRHDDKTSQDAAASIADELGCLPLALDQAAAYINQTRITPDAYLQRLREQPAAMYAARGGQAQRTVSRVWDITLEAIHTHHPPAVELLHILACYAPDNIPRVILGGTGGTGQLAIDEALGVLASYSMITLTSNAVTIHRLVQAILLDRQLSDEEGSAFGGKNPRVTALEWLHNAIPENPFQDTSGWPLLRALMTHAEYLSTRFPASDWSAQLGWTLYIFGEFRAAQGQYQQALMLQKSAAAILEATLGPNDSATAMALSYAGNTYNELGQAEKALPLQQRALEIFEATLGRNHVNTATTLNELSKSHHALGQPDKALSLQQRALEIFEATLGRNHTYTAITLNNLAATYSELGQYDKALPLQQQALEIAETNFGPGHPQTSQMLNNLGTTYNWLGQYDKALPLVQRALEIAETVFGPHHPSTARRLSNLAATYFHLGQADKALPLQERALEVLQASLGPDHPRIAEARDALAMICNDLAERPAQKPV